MILFLVLGLQLFAGDPTPSPTASPTVSPTPSPSSTPLPDLVFHAPAVNPYVSTQTFAQGHCDVVEGCIQSGTRRLLRFSTETRNIGEGNLNMGNPVGNPLFIWYPCHAHYHFESFADYALKNGDGVVVAGFKSSFCLLDTYRFDPSANPLPVFSCGAEGDQGIQSGWADIYSSSLPCQYIDITGVPPGSYTLEMVVNPDLIIVEADYSNNTIQVPVTISSPSPTPSPSPSRSPTRSPTPGASPTHSPTPTPTISPSPSPSGTPTVSPTPSPPPFNDSDLLGHTFPLALAPGEGKVVGVTLANTGNTTWTQEGPNGYALGVRADPCGIAVYTRFGLPPGDLVAPGQQHQFVGHVLAPGGIQNCEIELQMVQEFIEWFGDPLNLMISVENPANRVRSWERYE